MQKHIGWLWIVGFFGLLAAADAQTLTPPAASTQFDGTYAFVSGTKANETFRDYSNRERPCRQYPGAGQLIILNGQARYSGWSAGGRAYEFEGTVGSQGELTMRNPPTPFGRFGGNVPGIEIIVYGRIDGGGTIRARHTQNSCSYDLVWQKQAR